ncbi:MAG: hypothetical protein KDD27_16830 [Saprospiraceae bacterium]|nr:hypothetical protein [Saprospiraceae bacterium]
MKLKFFLLTFLLVFARGCDFYSTSLWFFDNPTGETNPLYRYFGIGWTGLIVANIIVVGLIIYAFYFYSFKYKMTRQSSSNKLTDFVSELYFNEKGRFLDVFYKTPKNKKTLLAHIGYVSVRVVIIASFLATFHNFCQFYNVSFYNTFREIVGRPLYVIYGLILSSFFYYIYQLWNREYRLTIDNIESEK